MESSRNRFFDESAGRRFGEKRIRQRREMDGGEGSLKLFSKRRRAFRDQQLAGLNSTNLVKQELLVGHLGKTKFARSDIRDCQAKITVPFIDGDQKIIVTSIQGVGARDGAGSNDTDHFSLNYALGGLWIFHLLTDGHFETGVQKLSDIGLGGMVRHSA